MPIHNMHFESGVFFTRAVGYVDDVDLRLWATSLKHHTKKSDSPVVALVDLREADRLSPTMLKILVSTLQSGNVLAIGLITSDTMNSRNASIISKIGALQGLRMFTNIDDGYVFARQQLQPSAGFYPAQSAFAYAVGF
ncbi:MAG: hypothetical protein Kow00117_13860 [Phototrophicales bacterium]